MTDEKENSLQVWTEKYRPKTLDEVINQRHVVERLKAWVNKGSVPNMLFAGPAGVGKTCCAIAVAREIYGEHWRENFQETNASDARGIDVIRGRIEKLEGLKKLGIQPYPNKFPATGTSRALATSAVHSSSQ